MYRHNQNHSRHISLHDCRAERMALENGVLSLTFPDGIWVTPEHEENPTQNVVRTGEAQVDFTILDEEIDGITVYVYRRGRKGRVWREEWEAQNFIDAVNEGSFQLEFLYDYRQKGAPYRLYHCVVWFEQRPYCYECELYLHTESAVYRWNELRCDRIW